MLSLLPRITALTPFKTNTSFIELSLLSISLCTPDTYSLSLPFPPSGSPRDRDEISSRQDADAQHSYFIFVITTSPVPQPEHLHRAPQKAVISYHQHNSFSDIRYKIFLHIVMLRCISLRTDYLTQWIFSFIRTTVFNQLLIFSHASAKIQRATG